jgi:hypothetical protein
MIFDAEDTTAMRREHRQPTRAELALITSRRPVVRKHKVADRSKAPAASPDAQKIFYPNRKHMFVPSEGG